MRALGPSSLLSREIGKQREPSFRRRLQRSQECLRKLEGTKLVGHDGCVNTITFTPDGTLAVSGSDDTYVRLWDVERGSCVAAIRSGHTENVFAAIALPFTNNDRIVTCAADGEVRSLFLSRGANAADFSTIIGEHEGRAHRLALQPGAPSCFLSCGEDGAVRHYDLRCPEASRGLLVPAFAQRRQSRNSANQRSIYSIDCNPSRPHEFYTGGDSPYVRILDQRRISRIGPVLCAAPARDGHDVVTGLAVDESGKELVASLNSSSYIYRYDIVKNAFTPDYAASSGSSGSASGSSSVGARTGASAAAASGGSSAGGGVDGGGGASGDESTYLTRYEGIRNRQTIKRVDWFGNGEYVVSGSDCGHIFFFEKTSGRLVQLLYGDAVGAVNCLASHPQCPYLASSGLEHDARLWKPTREAPVKPDALVGKNGVPAATIMARNISRRATAVPRAQRAAAEEAALQRVLAALAEGRIMNRRALADMLRRAGIAAVPVDEGGGGGSSSEGMDVGEDDGDSSEDDD